MSTSRPPGLDPETALPLVVGVTGHRDLAADALEPLREHVRAIFRQLKSDFPSTPLLLLSALADGADRLVAAVAAEDEFQVPVVAVLPMRRDLYEADFSAESRQEFADWLERRMRCWFELPLVAGNTEASIEQPGRPRNQQYAQVGEYVARHSQVLLVLWDGQPGKDGGTEQVFHFKKDGYLKNADLGFLAGSTRHSRLEPVEAALLCHVVTPRQDKPRPADALQLKQYAHASDENTGAEIVCHGEDASRAFWRIYAPLEEFNCGDRRRALELQPQRQQSRDYLLGESAADWPASLRAFSPLVQRFTLTDCLALAYQQRTLGTLRLLYGLVFLAVLLFELHAHDVYEHAILLLGFVLLLVAAYACHWWSQSRENQNRHQDYRALAEGLRIQLFWRLAGLTELEAPVADHYLLEHASELDWIRNALRTWSSSWSFPGAAGQLNLGQRPAPALDFVVKHWVQDQAAYFRRHAKGLHRKEKRLRFWSRPVVGISLLIVIGVLVASLLGLPPWGDPPSSWRHVPLLLVSMSLVAAALAHDYFTKQALAEHIKSYRRMRALFSKAERILLECTSKHEVKAAQEILKDLVREALAENGDWVLLRRGRPVEVPRP
jgi:hypothetical protein